MPEFQQKQRRPSNSSFNPPEDEYITERMAKAGQGNEASHRAGDALSNIDQVLAESGQATKKARDFLRDNENGATVGVGDKGDGTAEGLAEKESSDAASPTSIPNPFG